MESRNVDDKAESLWIKFTKGTDITEAFETHHIYSERPERLLDKYKIRLASEPRNFKFTFDDSGFYRTFKRKVGKKLQTIDRSPEQTSKVCLLFSIYNIWY